MSKSMESKELIAEFMGVEIAPDIVNDAYVGLMTKVGGCYQRIEYHTSWDWLMPVVEKIESLGYWVTMMPSQCQIYKANGNFYGDMVIDADFKNTRLENTYDAIVAFTEWYNQHPTN